jgi:hypothetical protein
MARAVASFIATSFPDAAWSWVAGCRAATISSCLLLAVPRRALAMALCPMLGALSGSSGAQKDQRIAALELAERADGAGVAGNA